MISFITKFVIRNSLYLGLALTATIISSNIANAQTPGRRKVDVVPTEVQISYKKGLKFLASQQAVDGSFSKSDQNRHTAGMLGSLVFVFLPFLLMAKMRNSVLTLKI